MDAVGVAKEPHSTINIFQVVISDNNMAVT
jgi:hypothetical protein